MSVPLQVRLRIPLESPDGAPLEAHQLRDAIALATHQLLDAGDPATAHEVIYPAADPTQEYKTTVLDPYLWDLATFQMKVAEEADEIVITASCEVQP